MFDVAPVVDLLTEAEKACNRAAVAVVDGLPSARTELAKAEIVRSVAIAQRALYVSSRAVSR